MTCSHCGQEIANDAKFCTHCGTASNNIYLPANMWRRFWNHMIDTLLIQLIGLGIIFGLSILLKVPENSNQYVWLVVAALSMYVLYFLILESVFGITLAKLITGTKVVNKEGNKPRFLQVLGRTFARYIPLEPLSFIFSKYPTGWHDMLSGTYVVKKNMTAEQVQAIDPKIVKTQKSSTMWIVLLIVLLVIAIIGILSSVVLASLSTAREKGKLAVVESSLNILKTQAEVYTVDHSDSYEGYCKTEAVAAMQKYVPEGQTYTCNDSKKSWAFSMPIPGKSEHACVDSNPNISAVLIPQGIGENVQCPSARWVVTEASNKAFTVESPGTMEVKTEKATVEEGMDSEQNFYKVYSNDGFFSVIQRTYSRPFTAAERSSYVENYIGNFTDQIGSKAEGLKMGVEEGKMVAEFVIPVPQSTEIIKAKLFVGKDASYMVLVGAEKVGFAEDSYKRFVSSFKITRE